MFTTECQHNLLTVRDQLVVELDLAVVPCEGLVPGHRGSLVGPLLQQLERAQQDLLEQVVALQEVEDVYHKASTIIL